MLLLGACTHRARRLACLPFTHLLQVHAGFLKAWYHHGFNTKVLARLRALAAAAPKALRFWVTGERCTAALRAALLLQSVSAAREHARWPPLTPPLFSAAPATNAHQATPWAGH